MASETTIGTTISNAGARAKSVAQSVVGGPVNVQNYASFVRNQMGRALTTQTGAAFKRGFGMAFGFMGEKSVGLGKGAHYFRDIGQGYRATGFLGWRETGAGSAFTKGASRAGMKGAGFAARQAAGMGSAMKAVRHGTWKGAAKSAGSMAFKAIMPAMTLYEMYAGYQEGGVMGAAGAGLQAGVTWGAWEVGAALLGGTTLTVAAVAAAGIYGGYQLGEAAQKHEKRLRHLEMGSPIDDPFGGVATTRQRSLAALQNSHINGRMALGNEGALMHYSPHMSMR